MVNDMLAMLLPAMMKNYIKYLFTFILNVFPLITKNYEVLVHIKTKFEDKNEMENKKQDVSIDKCDIQELEQIETNMENNMDTTNEEIADKVLEVSQNIDSLDCEESNIREYSEYTDKNISLSSPSQMNHEVKKKRSTSPFGKCVRRRWTEEEKIITYAAFKHHIISGTQPSFKEIQKLKDENPHVFANRNCATIKAWLNNQMKKKK
ncbi:uncharacterized protein LOC143902968 [Temnothorax americanus]|uniref:uncharacterized protein LOC143902968 n=1 Tax=Temnothorax americanus TaxID=1964332 RepID=UPI004069220A